MGSRCPLKRHPFGAAEAAVRGRGRRGRGAAARDASPSYPAWSWSSPAPEGRPQVGRRVTRGTWGMRQGSAHVGNAALAAELGEPNVAPFSRRPDCPGPQVRAGARSPAAPRACERVFLSALRPAAFGSSLPAGDPGVCWALPPAPTPARPCCRLPAPTLRRAHLHPEGGGRGSLKPFAGAGLGARSRPSACGNPGALRPGVRGEGGQRRHSPGTWSRAGSGQIFVLFWGCVCYCCLFRFVCGVRLAGSNWKVYPTPCWRRPGDRASAPRPSLSRARSSADLPRASGPGMALRPPGEAEPQDKVSYPLERLQSSPQHLAAYYTPFPPYGPYGNTLIAAEEDFQPFRQLAAAVSASQAMHPFAFRTAPPLPSPGLAVQREPLYDLPWHGKLPPWYPFPHLPTEPQHLLNGSQEDAGATREDPAHVGGRSDGGPCCGPEISIPPPPVDTSLLPERPKTSHLLPSFSSKQSEDGSKLPNPEGESAPRYHFTQEDLHLVLYGAIPSLEPSARLHHAASGLLVPTDGSGKGSPHHRGLGGMGMEAGRGTSGCI